MRMKTDSQTEINTDIEYSNDNETSLRELFTIFLRLGATSFGGPLAHIALMQREFVEKRRWFSGDEFLDMIGVVNLVPGPNSSELAMHIGHRRGGVAGLIVSGIAFILPAAILMIFLAAFYVSYGKVPQLQGVLHGLGAVVVAVIAQAWWKFAQTALKNRLSQIVALACLAATLIFKNEIAVLFGAALFGLVLGAWHNRNRNDANRNDANRSDDSDKNATSSTRCSPRSVPALFAVGGVSWSFAAPTIANIFLLFLKIGAILYGSGYVLIAFLRDDFVGRGWISDRQLLDAVAFGQFTPGPLFTTATFIGYILGGVGGAIAATIGIFLPSFFFVALAALVLRRFKNSPVLRSFLDCVNAASLVLMAVVTFQLGASSLGSPLLIALSVVALALLLSTKINAAWLLIGGAFLGWALKL